MSTSPTLAPPPIPSTPAPTSADRQPTGPAARGDVPVRTAAIAAGISYVVLFVIAVFANFVVREGLIVSGDAAATAESVAESEGMFRIGMLGFLVIFVLDIVVAWALHIVFRTVGRDLSLVAAWSRLVYTAFLGVAVIFFFQGLQLLDGAGLGAIPADERAAQALVAFETFNSTWLIGLLAFGLHLILIGAIILRSGIAPRGLAVVLVVAGLAYVVDTGAHTLLADYAEYADAFTAMVAVPAVLAEGWFGLWLLLRAGRGDRRSTATVETGAINSGPVVEA